MLTFYGVQNGVDEFETAEAAISRMADEFFQRVLIGDKDKLSDQDER